MIYPAFVPQAQVEQAPEMKAPVARAASMFFEKTCDERVVEEAAPPHGGVHQAGIERRAEPVSEPLADRRAEASLRAVKKIVEVELKQKGTALHDATVVGDTVGDPYKDTSSVALNPVIKFTTLFGLLAVELAVEMTRTQGATFTHALAAIFFIISMFFVWRSFYGMRIEAGDRLEGVGKMGADREEIAAD